MLHAAKISAGPDLRVGVIGVGVMGSNHARVLAEMPGVRLAGVADPDRKQAHFVGTTLGCPAVSTVEELLERGVDAVSIAAPTHLHRTIALACIERGVHVLVEKPIASSVAEGEDIIVAARRAGLTLMIGHVERFNPAVQAIADAIRKGPPSAQPPPSKGAPSPTSTGQQAAQASQSGSAGTEKK